MRTRSSRRRSSLAAGTALTLFVSVLASVTRMPALAARPSVSTASLASLATDPSPWLHQEANSLQRSPVYFGSTPRELALRLPPVEGGVARLPATTKSLGELQLKAIYQSLVPLLRTRYDDRSYLYNTDGIIFSEAGYPVVLFNEYLNYYTRLMRAAYHDMGDTSDKINIDYAVAITKVVIETAAREAGVPAA